MKEAALFERLEKIRVRINLCTNQCVIVAAWLR